MDDSITWAVLNCSVTRVLGLYATEDEARRCAEWFGSASFAYRLSADERRKLTDLAAEEVAHA